MKEERIGRDGERDEGSGRVEVRVWEARGKWRSEGGREGERRREGKGGKEREGRRVKEEVGRKQGAREEVKEGRRERDREG